MGANDMFINAFLISLGQQIPKILTFSMLEYLIEHDQWMWRPKVSSGCPRQRYLRLNKAVLAFPKFSNGLLSVSLQQK